jgi:hypothetical protein
MRGIARARYPMPIGSQNSTSKLTSTAAIPLTSKPVLLIHGATTPIILF